MKRNPKWAYRYSECTDCHSTEDLHTAHGKCRRCYRIWYYHNKPHAKEHARQYYLHKYSQKRIESIKRQIAVLQERLAKEMEVINEK